MFQNFIRLWSFYILLWWNVILVGKDLVHFENSRDIYILCYRVSPLSEGRDTCSWAKPGLINTTSFNRTLNSLWEAAALRVWEDQRLQLLPLSARAFASDHVLGANNLFHVGQCVSVRLDRHLQQGIDEGFKARCGRVLIWLFLLRENTRNVYFQVNFTRLNVWI